MSLRGSGVGLGALIAFLALDVGQIDAVQKHGEFRGPDGEAMFADLGTLVVLRGKAEGSFFEPFVEDGQSVVVVPPEEFDAVAAFGTKDEEIARERILAEVLLDDAGKSVKTFTHVGGDGAEENAAGQSEGHHEDFSRRVRSSASLRGSKPGGIRRTRPLAKTSSRGMAWGVGSRRSGTKAGVGVGGGEGVDVEGRSPRWRRVRRQKKKADSAR